MISTRPNLLNVFPFYSEENCILEHGVHLINRLLKYLNRTLNVRNNETRVV
jgi:hypothetical protein